MGPVAAEYSDRNGSPCIRSGTNGGSTRRNRGARRRAFFPEVRKERVDILCEVAERNSEGVMADAVRQPPMLGYHPTMVAAYKAMTGIDAQTIDGSLGKVYEDWIRWRAGFFTETSAS